MHRTKRTKRYPAVAREKMAIPIPLLLSIFYFYFLFSKSRAMIIPTHEIREVYEFLFKHGCLVVEYKPTAESHPMINVTNHKVMKIMKRLISKNVVSKTFVWRHAYYTLTDDGIVWLRNILYLDETASPITHVSVPIISEKTALTADDAEPNFRRS